MDLWRIVCLRMLGFGVVGWYFMGWMCCVEGVEVIVIFRVHASTRRDVCRMGARSICCTELHCTSEHQLLNSWKDIHSMRPMRDRVLFDDGDCDEPGWTKHQQLEVLRSLHSSISTI
jgi:hypothetical protein